MCRELGSSGLKQSAQVSLAFRKTVGELKTVVSLEILHPDAPADIPLDQPFQKVGRRVGGLLGVGSQKAQAGELINGGVLEQAQAVPQLHYTKARSAAAYVPPQLEFCFCVLVGVTVGPPRLAD